MSETTVQPGPTPAAASPAPPVSAAGAAPAAAAAASKTPRGRRRAVVVGINDYPSAPLDSCVNDARYFSRLLAQFGFESIKPLLDADASKENVLYALQDLFKGATADDRLVFFYSGHGASLAREDDPSIQEEFLCLHDAFLQDDELTKWSQSVPTGVLTCVFDSCFSAGMEKVLAQVLGGVAGFRPPTRPAPGKIKTLPSTLLSPFAAFSQRLTARHYKPFGRASRPVLTPGQLPERKDMLVMPSMTNDLLNRPSDEDGLNQQRLNGLLVSACLEGETAAASMSGTNGMSAFTWSLSKAISELGPGRSTRELMVRATAKLREIGAPQTPQIKEPLEPAGVSERTFLDLRALPHPPVTTPTTVNLAAQPIAGDGLSPTSTSSTPAATPLSQLLSILFASRESTSMNSDKNILELLPVIIQVVQAVQSKGSGGFGGVGGFGGWEPSPFNPGPFSGDPMGGFDKSLLGDAIRIAGGLVKSGDTQPMPTSQKDWLDNIGRVVQIATTIVPLLKSQQSKGVEGGSGTQKNTADDIIRIATAILPLLKSGGMSQQPAAQDKNFLSNLAHILPIILAVA